MDNKLMNFEIIYFVLFYTQPFRLLVSVTGSIFLIANLTG